VFTFLLSPITEQAVETGPFDLSSSSYGPAVGEIALKSPVLADVKHQHGSYGAGEQHYDLTIDSGIEAPDGYPRRAIRVNGKFGAPLLTAYAKDRLFVNVTNHISDPEIRNSTSIHWHGPFQNRTQSEDGAAFITQCPISPGHNYVYNFSTVGQTGTYWYHSHLSDQYCDGLRGPLVIYDPEDPLKYLYDVDDESTVITLGEWYHDPSIKAMALALEGGKLSPEPKSILINDVGKFPGGPKVNNAVVPVKKGLRYRLRFVNLGCLASIKVAIDDHRFTVIEADGQEIQPLEVDSIRIFPGQRYSVVVNANQTIGNYWIRTSTIPALHEPIGTSNIYNAILRYDTAPEVDPETITGGDKELKEEDMVPWVEPGSLGDKPADFNETLNFRPNFSNLRWEINNVSFFSPKMPELLQILNGNTKLVPEGSIITVKGQDIVELTIPDTLPVANAHPFHLHGHAFDVIKSAYQTERNYKNPPRRDVVGVYGDSEVVIRFRADNAGPWIFHCHIDWHLNRGLAVVIAEDVPGVKEHAYIPPAWNELCPIYDALPPYEQ